MAKVETMKPSEVAKLLGVKVTTIYVGLRTGRFKFGYAIPPKKGGKKWNYLIIKKKVEKELETVIESEDE